MAVESLSREDWERAALEALAENGLSAVAVEPLARRLGVTKGSFYWHFADRRELLAAVLLRWEQEHTEEVIERHATVGDPRERLALLIRAALRGKTAARVHIVLAGAASDAVIAAALARVSRRRVEYMTACYAELGLARAEAHRRAQLAYTSYVGLLHYRHEAPDAFPNQRAFDGYVDHVIATLVEK